jgi:SNF2 family DNA or RNA helicase
MFSGLKRIFGNVTVEQRSDTIFIEGVRAEFIEKDIVNYFGGRRVTNNMFDFKTHSFSLPSFFCPDFLFTVERLMDSGNSLKVSVNTLNKIRNGLLQNTWLKDIDQEPIQRLNRDKLKLFKLTPLDYQTELFDNYEKATYNFHLNGYLFAASAGLGKTAAALMLAECLEADKVIIVSPKNAIHKAWQDNIVNHFKEIPSYWISDGSKPFTGKEKYIVIHYEYLGKLLEQLHLMKFNQPFVVLDESHNFNEIKSNRTGLFLDLCNQLDTQDILMLSGTPIKATALESIPLLRALDPSFTEDVEKRFRAIFKGDNTKAVEILSNRLGQMTFKVAKDKSNLEKPIFKSLPVSFNGSEKYTLDTIKVKMREFIIERNDYYKAREKEDKKFFQDCLDHFQSVTRDKETLKLYGEYQIALKKVIQSGGSWDAKDEMIFCNRFENKYIIPVLRQEDRAKFKSIKSLIKYRSLVIQGECLGRIVGRARIDCHVDMCKYIDFASICESTHKKTLVFTSFTEVAVATVNSLTDKEFNPLIVYAKTNHDLKNIVERFYKDQNANPLVATYASLSTAVPITCANVVVMIDTPFRDYIMNQAISRTHRLGQDSQVYVYTAVLDTQGKPNISTRTVDILKWSQQQTEEILNIKSPFKLEDVGGLEVSVEAYVHKLEEDCVVVNDLVVKAPSFKDW